MSETVASLSANIQDDAVLQHGVNEANAREEFYRQLLDDQVVLICRVDMNSMVIFANQAFCKFFSTTLNEIQGKRLLDLGMMPVDDIKMKEYVSLLQPDQPIIKHEDFITGPNGQMVWMEWTEKGIFNGEGKLIEVQVLGHDITEFKYTQQRLRMSRENFWQLAHTAPALIYISRPEEDRLLWVNAGFGDFMGYTVEECLSINTWELIHPDFRELVKEDSLAILMDPARRSRQDIKIITKDGTELWQDLSKSYIEFEGRGAVLGVGYDVTERKMAEERIFQQNLELQASYNELEAMNEEIRESQEILLNLNKQLQESQERLELALWGSDEGLWDWDYRSGKVLCNDRLIKMLGYDPQIFGCNIDSWFDLACPEDQALVWRNLNDHLQGNIPCYEIEYRVKTNSGDYMWVFDRGKVVERDTDGNVLRIVGMRMDITARKEAEKAIIEARNRYSTLIAAIPELVMQINLNYEYNWVNDLACNFYGLDVLGSPLRRFYVCPHEFEAMIAGLESLKQSRIATFNHETWQYRQDGEKRLLHWQVKSLFNEDTLIGHIATARDLTEMHAAEEKIRFLSFHDSLTGLYNRAFAAEELKRLDTHRQLPLSIIMGDLNALKLTNDAFGHAEGDKLLTTIADLLRKACRNEDVIARWGGDEFVVILPQTSHREAYRICRRIQQFCQEAPAYPIQPSIALGAASKLREDQDLNDVLAEAEDIMYRNKLLEGKSLRNTIIFSLEQSLHERTHETPEHARNMQEISILFARRLELPVNEIERLILLAKLHDIGKLGISDDILAKPGKLSEEEWDAVKKHPEIGFRITKASHDLISIADEVLSHHERWDGTGYPRSIGKEEIPYLARVITLIDSYDVMTRGRPYKAAISSGEAINEIKRCSGTQFDPRLVETFLTVFDHIPEGGTAILG